MAAREGDRRSLRLRNMAERHGLPISQSKTRLLARSPAPVVVTVVFTSFISVTYGFGVYLFAALMPEMRATLTFDYAFAGAVAGYAQIGYLSSSLAIGFLAPLIGPARTVAGSMVICTICLLALSGIGSPISLAALLVCLAAMAASVWTPMAQLAQQLIPEQHQGKALGLMSSGTSYGVFINGLIVPPLVLAFGWRSVWLVVGATAACLTLIGILSLSRLGDRHFSRDARQSRSSSETPQRSSSFRGPLILLIIMFLSGLACMPFQTFLTSYLRDEHAWSPELSARIWSMIGIAGMFGGFLMGSIADRISVKRTLTLAFVLLFFAAAIACRPTSPAIVFAGAGLFGIAFNSIFGLVPAYVSKTTQGTGATRLFGVLNLSVGLGNMSGNIVGGNMRETLATFNPMYVGIAGIVLVLILLTFLLPSDRRKIEPAGDVDDRAFLPPERDVACG